MKMDVHKENDTVRPTKSVSGAAIGEEREVVLPAGIIATVVLVHGDPNNPMAYEVEAYVPEQD